MVVQTAVSPARARRPLFRIRYGTLKRSSNEKMTEGRRCQVHLLDDRKLELLVQPKLLAKELLDLVASHFNLKEKEYFGIAFTDETAHFSWLQLDRRVLEHDFPKKSGPVVLYFCVKFYIESIAYLRDNATIELFFLNAKSCIYKELIEVDTEAIFELAAYILQEAKGDYSSNEVTRAELKKLPVLPTQALKDHPSLAYCEDRVIEHHKKVSGQTRGQAIVNYMSIAESLPTYGVHYYAVKTGSQESDSSQSAKKDMLAALKSRQDALEDTLRVRLEELKKLCLREAELTGKLPKEYPLDPGEEPPTVRRRIGTSFKLDEQKIMPKGEEVELERLEREFAIQSQITEAARRLATDPNVSKKMKKQRKMSYLNALKKLQDIENAINEYRVRSGKKPTQRASLIIEEANIGSEDSSLSDALVLEDEDCHVTSVSSPVQSPHKGLPPRPPSHQRPPPPQSLDGLRQLHYHRSDYDKSPIKPKMWKESSLDEPYEKVKKRGSHSHSSGHTRFPSVGSCAEAGAGGSLQSSPVRSASHWNSSQSSMPSTPDLQIQSPPYVHSTRLVDISPTRLHSLAQHFRHRSASLESQGKLVVSENETGSPDFYTPRTRSSNGSDPLDDCSSCTSHSSSEHYYPAHMHANYSTLAEDSPSKARERQRHRSAGNLGSSNSGSMPNLAAKNGSGNSSGFYLHSQSQPSSQYRIKEYPLYIEGSPTPVVVRSLENDQEGHYSVKAQFKTSNSYTAGGIYKDSWHGDDIDSVKLTPSRSQVVRTPSLVKDNPERSTNRTALSDELRSWYERSSATLKEHNRLSHTSSDSSDRSSPYSTSQSTFMAHSRITRMPQPSKATSAVSVASPRSQRSTAQSADSVVSSPSSSPHHIVSWQSGPYQDTCYMDSPLYSELADIQWYGSDNAKPGTLV
ncbi:FERM domain-containing protein 4A [Rhincodon typus]|uniref:FERM domain-containing protein 4A n=1 Tax=Rhincodon typus TaxID=259920 RepID=UPI00202F8772|nr:FERM domain-containing protein 4A [Rhincodon typus]